MRDDNKYLIATAEIGGEVIEFKREGKKEGFYMYKQYTSWDVECLKSHIQDNMHLIRSKFNKEGYFFSDIACFCKLYLPDLICELLKREFKTEVNSCGQGSNYIIYTDKIDYNHACERFNKHFDGNL